MADSGALRTERYKRHKMGDHSICRHDGAKPKITLPAPETSAEGDDFDPAAELRRLAELLAEAYRHDPGNALLAKELRTTLLALPPPPEGPDVIDQLQARYRARRAGRDPLADMLSTPEWS